MTPVGARGDRSPVLRRAANLFKYRLERFLVRGASFRLLFIAALIGLLSLVGGVAVAFVSGGFETLGEAIWWAFLRLTDPGYLGDDLGTFKRVVSTFLTIAGYVVFLGALVAIMTQWLNQTMRRLEMGLTPIAQNDHVLLLGWSTRTVTILRELLESRGRVRRFLRSHGARRLQVVLLDEKVGPELTYELRERLEQVWRGHKIVLRSGSPLRLQHLQRVDFAHAAAIVVASDDVDDPTIADTTTIKTLLSMSTHGKRITDEGLPLVVAEVLDARKVHIARKAFDGPIEVLASDRAIGRLMAQAIRLPGIAEVFEDMITGGEGHALYVREPEHLVGASFASIVGAYDLAVPLGLARRQGKSFRPLLGAGTDVVIEEDDRIVFLARDHDDTEADRPPEAVARKTVPAAAPSTVDQAVRRVLLIGWSHKVPPLLKELERYAHEKVEVDVLSATPIDEREDLLRRYAKIERITVRMLRGDRTVPSDMRDAQPGKYDNVVLIGSDWTDTREESDARTVVSFLLLQDVLAEQKGARPRVLVELYDRSNEALFAGHPVEVIVSPLVVGRMLAQIALRQELRAIFDQLLGSRGPELTFRPASTYGVEPGERTFRELQAAAIARGDILVGLRVGPIGTPADLNPDRATAYAVTDELRLLVLTSSGGGSA